MKLILRSGAVAAAVGVGLSLAVLPAMPANAAAAIRVPCNDITALKNAINRANASANGGAIALAPHCVYTLTAPDNTADGLPEITGNVTIAGRDTTIRRAPNATQEFRIFQVRFGGTLTLNSITVSGGVDSSRGGGIFNNQGTLNLNRTIIKGNQAPQGGGISNLSGQVKLDRSTLERNTGTFGGGINNNGGGTIAMKGGSLRNNRAVAVNSAGGGLLNAVGTASLESASVRGNTAIEGGGLYNSSGMRLTATTVRDNIAVSGAGISNHPGPLLGSAVTLVRSQVTRNTAITAGGGILNLGDGQVTLTDSRVIRNRPDNCSPAGSVPGCTNPTGTVTPPASKLPLPPKDGESRK